MDRLISLEPSNLVLIRIKYRGKCYGELTLRNLMHTMPVAFRLQPLTKALYTVRPQSGIIGPLTTLTVEITYHLPQYSNLPQRFPHTDDQFQLHSVMVPGAAVKDSMHMFDSVPNDWFTTKKKQVFVDSGLRIMFVGAPVLAQLVTYGEMDEIREVLEKSDPGWKLADSMDSNGQTLLHLAIAKCRPDLVQLLLEFGPDTQAHSRSGSSPLEAAAAAGEALIVELLLAHKASTERSEYSPWGPIHHAARGGHMEILKLLLLKNANVDAPSKDGNTALHLAVTERRRDCAALLLASGARIDIQNNGAGDTALHIAAYQGDEQMVMLLLQKGANKEVRNKYGKTACDLADENGYRQLLDALGLGDSLCMAARKGDYRTIQRLLEDGAAVNGKDHHGWTALHRASFKGKIKAAEALIDKGADIEATDDEGYTALHCAVESGQVDVVEMLVKKGADVGARTNQGVSAMHIAESLDYSGIRRILVQSGPVKGGVVVIPKNRETAEFGEVKRQSSRRVRGLSSSFGRSSPLTVV